MINPRAYTLEMFKWIKPHLALAVFMGCILLLHAMSSTANVEAASRKQRQPAPAGTEIKTEYFSLRLPQGWRMLKPVKTHPNGDVSAVFVPDDASLAVTINFIHVPVSAQVIAETAAQNIEKTGFKASPLKEENGICSFDISGKGTGKAWFGANGKICAIILMFGSNFGQANKLLDNIKSPYRSIMPLAVN